MLLTTTYLLRIIQPKADAETITGQSTLMLTTGESVVAESASGNRSGRPACAFCSLHTVTCATRVSRHFR